MLYLYFLRAPQTDEDGVNDVQPRVTNEGKRGGEASAPKSAGRVQFKQQLAGLSMADQVQMVRPAPMMVPGDSAVQMTADVVQMGGGGASSVPKNIEDVRAYMTKNYPVLAKYVNRDKLTDDELVPYLKTCKTLAAQAKKLHAAKKKIPAEMKQQATDALIKAMEISATKNPEETKELRGVYKDMGKKVVPKWQKTLEEAKTDKKELAKLAVMHRNAYKTIVREHQQELNLVRIMELRNEVIYNDAVGPTFKLLYDKHKLAGKTDSQACDEIIGSAGRSNKRANKATGN